jgi:hypothetical protein
MRHVMSWKQISIAAIAGADRIAPNGDTPKGGDVEPGDGSAAIWRAVQRLTSFPGRPKQPLARRSRREKRFLSAPWDEPGIF